MKQILIEDEIQAVQKAGFETPDIVANYSSYCINKTTYQKVKSLRDSSVCEFIQGPNLCLGSIRKFCVLKEGHIAIIDVYERVPEGLLDAFKPSLQEL